ncbi:MAG TPA: signal recognition particle-docking protein FtsY [Candidatus Limnocylindrales bacterium]|nr:signal recognition particle-docking protein FtsY [Candidatus Limnocylindrales bacterium]
MFWRKKEQPAAESEEAPAERVGSAEPSEPAAPAAQPAPVSETPPAEPAEPTPPASEPAPRPGALWGPGVGPPPPEVAAAFDLGLARTRDALVGHLRGAFHGDQTDWDEVEETLIAADVGATLAMEVVERARAKREQDPEAAVRRELRALLVDREPGWEPRAPAGGGPAVVLVVGVNGTGKTTTIGKLAARYKAEGRRVVLAAADTFRAAAIDQLRVWADRAGVEIVAHKPDADPGAVVYDALDAAVARGADLVIADTAGRLHTKANLMDELSKIRRIVDKRLPGAEPETLFVIDATTGQNGLGQATAFNEAVGLTGVVLTKLDSTAKGGIVFAIEHDLEVPVRFIGVGEKIGDLLPFDPEAFVNALFGEAAP